MNFRFLKVFMVIVALIFATQGCAVFVRDDDHYYHRPYRHWRSSVEQSTQAMAQRPYQDGGNSGYARQ